MDISFLKAEFELVVLVSETSAAIQCSRFNIVSTSETQFSVHSPGSVAVPRRVTPYELTSVSSFLKLCMNTCAAAVCDGSIIGTNR
jgi:hypothetical protein